MQLLPDSPGKTDLNSIEELCQYLYGDTLLPDDPTDDTPRAIFWACGAKPGYPRDWASFHKDADASLSSGRPRTFYMGMSSMLPMYMEDGTQILRNRQQAYYATHFLILDDIGTGPGAKQSASRLPKALAEGPTYVIETSPGNFQYGYAFDEPVTDIDFADALLRELVLCAGTDAGGMMVNKAVRLHGGNNLKEAYIDEEGEAFQCKLVHFQDIRYSPDALLDAAESNCGVEELIDRSAIKRRVRTTTVHKGREARYMAGAGDVTDPVLIWMNSRGVIMDEGINGDWITVQCPNHAEHTSGDGSAGYSPLGRGGGDFATRRTFNCFHEHCAGYKTPHFLAWVQREGGPAAAAYDETGGVIARSAIIATSSTMLDLQTMRQTPTAGWKESNQDNVFVVNVKGEAKAVPKAKYILSNPGLMKIEAEVYQPGGSLIIREDDRWLLNTWRRPDHCDTALVPADDHPDVVRLKAFLEYLLPYDWEFMLQHMAKMVQDINYRGPAILMYAPVQGTGRNTFLKILSCLFGNWNNVDLSLDELLRGVSGDGFNPYMRRDIITISEVEERSSNTAKFKGYELLKRFVEPNPVSMVLREKYKPEQSIMCTASLFLCTNHPGAQALALDPTDRRFMEMDNITAPQSAQYFTELHNWLNAHQWEEVIWGWLMDQDVADFTGLAEVTRERGLMDEYDTQSPVDKAVTLIAEICDTRFGGFVELPAVELALATHGLRFGLYEKHMEVALKQIKRAAGLVRLPKDTKQYWKLRQCGNPGGKLRVLTLGAAGPNIRRLVNHGDRELALAEYHDKVRSDVKELMVAELVSLLDEYET